MKKPEFDICVIGAGVAGGTMAAYLANKGFKVAVVEKSLAEQDRIVGELLQPGGVIKLQEMGFAGFLTGFDAVPIYGYGLFMHGENFKVNYPLENGEQLTGRGFRNGKFVQQIRKHILNQFGITVFEGAAETLVESNGRVTGIKFSPKGSDGLAEIVARLTIVSDGMFSGFRQELSAGPKKVSSYFLGMLLTNCQLPYANFGHVVVAEPSPCLIYPVSSTETRILIDFPGAEAPRKGKELTDYLTHTIGPQLPAEILPAFMAAVEEGKFKVMPNHLIPARPLLKPGVVLLGDSLNMRHPLTGGGMTAALTDVKNLGDLLAENCTLFNAAEVDKAVNAFYKTRHKQNATINILADALYGVMKDKDLKEACYSYLKRGGNYAAEPVSILSAVSRDVNLLLRHFFAVAIFGVANITRPMHGLSGIKRSFKMMRAAVQIVSPLVLNERPGFFTRTAFRIAGGMF